MTRIAYLGPAGTFTEEAARRFDLPAPEYVAVDSPAQALDAVRDGEVDYAVVAVENSVDGAVTSTADALVAPGVEIYAETELPIAFAIMTRRGASLDQARLFSTHPVAQQQVKSWIAAHLEEVQFLPATSNAAAARMVAEGAADVAAAPERAAELFDLEVHARGVADLATARTRFILVGPAGGSGGGSGSVTLGHGPTGCDRTFIVFQTANKPGALASALQELAARGVDMSRIESRPTREVANTYHFFVELVGHRDDAPVADALRGIEARVSQLRFLGSWPRFEGSGDRPC